MKDGYASWTEIVGVGVGTGASNGVGVAVRGDAVGTGGAGTTEAVDVGTH